jgi:hypothetical protein
VLVLFLNLLLLLMLEPMVVVVKILRLYRRLAAAAVME